MAELSFVSIDFETANRDPRSACAVAVVEVAGGAIVRRETHLLRPPAGSRRFVFTRVHGLRWRDVASAPVFADVWARHLEPMLRRAPFVAAHNARFDAEVLAACAAGAGVQLPPLRFLCTVRLANAAWGLRPARLPNVAAHLGLPLKHHDPTSDAECCARIVLSAAREGPLTGWLDDA